MALLVERPSRSHYARIGRRALDAHGAEQGRLEPAAELVSAFEIKIRGPGIAGFVGSKRQVAGAGLEPHVEDVGFALEFRSTAMRTFGARWQHCVSFRREPRVCSEARKQLDNSAIDDVTVQRLAATLAKKHCNGYAPDALSRNTPIRPRSDHVRHALFAPCRIPFHVLDFFQRPAAQRAARHRRFHRDEPLFGSTKNYRIVAAPAVRIGVFRRFRVKKRAALPEQFRDGRVGDPNFLARVLGQPVAKDAFFVHVAGGIEAVLHPGGEVFGAVGGRGVNHTCTRIHGDVIGQHAQDLAIQKRMLEIKVLQLPSGKMRQLARIGQIALFRHVSGPFGRND